MSPNKDKTGNERQQRRREREKAWLKEHGFESWEALHTDAGEFPAEKALAKPVVLSTQQADSTPAPRW